MWITQAQCIAGLTAVKKHTADIEGWGFAIRGKTPVSTVEGAETVKMGFVSHCPQSYANVGSPYLMGFISCQDEPVYPSQYQAAVNEYNLNKANFPHLITMLGNRKDGVIWEQAADVVTFGIYPYKHSITDYGDTTKSWSRKKAQYGYERFARDAFSGSLFANFDETDKPWWMTIQSLGGLDSSGAYPTTLAEGRAMRYNVITWNVKGFTYWTYGFSGVGFNGGLYLNKTALNNHNNLTDEINYMSDILVLPTKDYNYYYHTGNSVSFDKTLYYNLYGQGNRPNWNWMLKESNGVTYLIILNKDNRPVSNVQITIANLPGIRTARTLGLAKAGAHPGDEMIVNNGVFIDSFAGLEVIIYEIGNFVGTTIPPATIPPTNQINSYDISFTKSLPIFEILLIAVSAIIMIIIKKLDRKHRKRRRK